MASILTVVSTLQRNRSSWVKNLLINSSRVVDFFKDEQNPLTRTILHYRINDFERGETWELQLNHYVNTVSTRLFEDETNPFIWMDVQTYKQFGKEEYTSTTQRKWKVNADNIVYAYDLSNGTQSYVWINRGLNFVRLLTSHTVADLSRAYSKSASLSKS